MLGYEPDELIGQPGEVICAEPESYAALGEIAGPLISRGGQLDVEWELKRKDGSTFVARLIAKALDPESPQQGTVWIVEDITDKRRDADEVARLLREQEAILATASIGIVFIKDRRIVRCNRRYEEMYGYGPGELEGKPTAVLYTDISEHAKAGAPTRRSRAARPRAGSSCAGARTAATFWSRADGRAVDPLDPHRGSVWIVEDVTERRRAEEDLRRVVGEQQALLDNVFGRHRVQRATARWCAATGASRRCSATAPGEAAARPGAHIYFTDEEYRRRRAVYEELDQGLHARSRAVAAPQGWHRLLVPHQRTRRQPGDRTAAMSG